MGLSFFVREDIDKNVYGGGQVYAENDPNRKGKRTGENGDFGGDENVENEKGQKAEGVDCAEEYGENFMEFFIQNRPPKF